MQPSGTVRYVVLVCLSLSVGDVCRAQSPYRLETRREWILVGTGAALGVTALVVGVNVDPLTVEEINALDPGDINEFDVSVRCGGRIGRWVTTGVLGIIVYDDVNAT